MSKCRNGNNNKKNQNSPSHYFFKLCHIVRFLKFAANEQGFAMLGDLKNVSPEPKPN
jgi:hypothetical protein